MNTSHHQPARVKAGYLPRTDAGGRFEPGTPHQVSDMEGWILREYAVVGSTNLVAAGFKAWEAVRADRQSAGRGRFQRSWVSDEGGLWLSAVVPIDVNSASGRALPMAVGLAVSDALRGLGVQGLRMRWPNDVLVKERKLAGLLVDQFVPGLAVAGIGINVFNQPEASEPLLKNQTTRLADLLATPPSVRELAAVMLGEIRRVAGAIESGGWEALLPRVNKLWGRPRPVELDLDGEKRSGVFRGVDAAGRLILSNDLNEAAAYEPWQVRHLTEINKT